jgi:Mismatch repair ATPase (MutS family)
MATNLSILYTADSARNELPGACDAFAALELDRLLVFKDSWRYFCDNAEVINRRADVMLDVLRSEKLYSFLRQTLDDLRGLELEAQSQQTKVLDGATSNEVLLGQLFVVKYYITVVDKLEAGRESLLPELKSAALTEFFEAVRVETSEAEYIKLRENLNKLDSELIDVKSVTIGLNFDTQLRVREAGLVSVHSEPFRSGNIIDKLLRGEFKKTDFDCLAPLTVMTGDEENPKFTMFNEAVRRALGEAFRESLRSWKQPVKQFITERAARFAGLADELRFILCAVDYLKQLKAANLSFCKPKISTNESTFSGLYNPFLRGSAAKIVTNSISFDDCRLYVLTGANSGGKSVFTYSVGIAQALFQCGIPISALSAELRVCDRIFVRAPASEDKSAADHIKNAEGRLENEVKAVMDILRDVTGDSLVLLDEAFSSTGAEDAAELAKIYCVKLLNRGAMTVFATHLHGLAMCVDAINGGSEKYKADTLTVGSGDTDRFRVRRAAPEGKSFAMKIADKYGLV